MRGDAADEYAHYCRHVASLIEQHAERPAGTLLDIGCGGGKNVFNLKGTFSVTGVDLSPTMLAQARDLNPESTFVHGDMRTFRLVRRSMPSSSRTCMTQTLRMNSMKRRSAISSATMPRPWASSLSTHGGVFCAKPVSSARGAVQRGRGRVHRVRLREDGMKADQPVAAGAGKGGYPMRRPRAILSGCMSLALCASACAPAAPPLPTNAAIDTEATRLMARERVVGMAVAVIDRGVVVRVAAYGQRNAERKLPLQTDTIMYSASLTKVAFAYMVMQLVDEGRLDLDRSIADYLPRPLPEYEDYTDLAGDERWRMLTRASSSITRPASATCVRSKTTSRFASTGIPANVTAIRTKASGCFRPCWSRASRSTSARKCSAVSSIASA